MAENEKKNICSFIMVMVTNHVTNAGIFIIDVKWSYIAPEYNEDPEKMAWTVKLCGECLNSIIHEHDERNFNRRK